MNNITRYFLYLILVSTIIKYSQRKPIKNKLLFFMTFLILIGIKIINSFFDIRKNIETMTCTNCDTTNSNYFCNTVTGICETKRQNSSDCLVKAWCVSNSCNKNNADNNNGYGKCRPN